MPCLACSQTPSQHVESVLRSFEAGGVFETISRLLRRERRCWWLVGSRTPSVARLRSTARALLVEVAMKEGVSIETKGFRASNLDGMLTLEFILASAQSGECTCESEMGAVLTEGDRGA